MPSHWGHPRPQRGHEVLAHRHAVPPGGGLRGGRALPRRRAACRTRRRPPSPATRSSTAPPATARPPRASSGRASTPPRNLKLPVLYLIEDNGYAISVPVEVQTAGGSISKLVRSFPNLLVREVDGCDPLASLAVLSEAVAWCRARQGPALVHAHVIRPYSHSLSDDEALYRAAGGARGGRPARPPRHLPARGSSRRASPPRSELAGAARGGRPGGRRPPPTPPSPPPPPDPGERHPATSTRRTSTRRRAAFATEPAPAGRPQDDGRPAQRLPPRRDGARPAHRGLRRRTWPTAPARQSLDEVKGKGGVFKVTHNLQRRHGSRPRLQLPARRGQHRRPRHRHGHPRPQAGGRDPVLRLHLARLHADPQRAGPHPLALERRLQVPGRDPRDLRRLPAGRRGLPQPVRRGALHPHARACAWCIPSNAQDANGLLRTAIRCDDPVLFLEHKHLYRQTHNKGVYPGPDYMIPFGKAARVREGRDLTVVTYGALVQRSLVAAKQAGPGRASRPRSSTCARSAPTTGRRSPRACARPGGCSWPTRTASPGATAPRSRPAIGGRALRAPRRPGAPRGGARHLRGLQPGPRGRHPAPGRRRRRRPARDRRATERGRRPVAPTAGRRPRGQGSPAASASMSRRRSAATRHRSASARASAARASPAAPP